MSDVNSWLADYFGNATEKTAAQGGENEIWTLFKAAAAEDGIDAEQLTDEEVDALAEHYIATETEEEEEDELPPNWDGEDVDHYNALGDAEKTAFVQFKEAEFLGQVMAHSMEAERSKIAAKDGGFGQKAMKALRYAAKGEGITAGREGLRQSGKTRNAGNALRQMGEQAGKAGKSGKAKKFGDKAGKRFAEAGAQKSQGRKDLAKGIAATGALYGGGTAALGGAGYAAGRSKKAAAIDALAEARAIEFLKQAGVEIEDDEQSTDDMIDQRAAQLLIDNGYGELLQ